MKKNATETIEELRNPKEKKLVVRATSVLISRQPKGEAADEFKTITLRFFEQNNPHKLQVFPKKVIIYTNIEKARLMSLNVSYYLEGNDIVVNDLEELQIEHEGTKLFLKGKQQHVERRK